MTRSARKILLFGCAVTIAMTMAACGASAGGRSATPGKGLKGQMRDRADIQDAIARFYAAVDAREWDGVAALMTDPFHLDYSSFGGGDPADLGPDTIIGGWKSILPGFEHTHHQLGNMDIEVEDKSATVRCYVTATHVIGDRVWTVVGRYRNTLVLQGTDWKLSGSQFIFKYQTGATDLPNTAKGRVTKTD